VGQDGDGQWAAEERYPDLRAERPGQLELRSGTA
jgi:hypothetical protein